MYSYYIYTISLSTVYKKAIKSDVIIHSHLHNKNKKVFHVKLCHINFLLMSVLWLSLTIFTRYEFNSGTNLPQIIISRAFQWIFLFCNLPHFRKYFTFRKIFIISYLPSPMKSFNWSSKQTFFWCTYTIKCNNNVYVLR